MKKIAAGVIVALLNTCAAAPCHADKCAKAAALAQGAPAPCAGLLVTSEWAAKGLRCLDVELPTCRADALRDVTLASAATAACNDRLEAAKAGLSRALDAQAAAEARANAPVPWYSSPTLWGAGGAVLGVLAGIGLMRVLGK